MTNWEDYTINSWSGRTGSSTGHTEMPTVEERPGYVFDAWYENDDFSGDPVTTPVAEFPVGGKTYYAHWLAQPSQFEFVTDHGTINTDRYNYIETVEADATYRMVGETDEHVADTVPNRSMPTPERAGYQFDGWYQTVTITTETPVETEKTDADGNKYTETEIVVTTEEQEVLVDRLPEVFPVGKTTFTAHWTALDSALKFEANGGNTLYDITGKTDESVAEKNGNSLSMPQTLRDGYTFRGWFQTQDEANTAADMWNAGEIGAGEQAPGYVTQLVEKFPPVGKTYYAAWTANPSIFHFVTNEGSAVEDMVGVTDEKLTNRSMPKTERDGYTFAGWHEAEDLSDPVVSVMPASFPVQGKTYYAAWTADPAYIQFRAFGGVAAEGSSLDTMMGDTNQKLTDVPDAGYTRDLPEVTRPGYTFDGWYLQNGTDDDEWGEEQNALPERFPPNTTTYFAKWNPLTVRIDLNTTSGVLSAEDQATFPEADASTYRVSGQTGSETGIATFPTPTRDGYTFTGWFANENYTGTALTEFPMTYEWNEATEGGSDSQRYSTNTYYARWSPNNAYIEFKTDGGSAIARMTGKTDQSLLVDGARQNMPTTTKAGYTFDGWYKDKELTEAVDEIDGAQKLPAAYGVGTITYYAAWTADQATITLNLYKDSDDNWVTVHLGTDTNATVTGVTDATVNDYVTDDAKADENGALNWYTEQFAHRTGYAFAGWFANQNFTGTSIRTFPTTFAAGNIDYYAKWTALESRIAFDTDGGSPVSTMVGKTDQSLLDGEGQQQAMPTTTKVGYTFAGWYPNAEQDRIRPR